MSDNLETLIERLEKVQASLDKRQTVPLRAERDELAVEIQQIVEAHRHNTSADWRYENSHLLTHEQIEESKGNGPSPAGIKAGMN